MQDENVPSATKSPFNGAPKMALAGAVFSPDGKRVVAVFHRDWGQEAAARVWLVVDVDWDEPVDLIQARVRARLGIAVTETGDVQPLSDEDLAAAWQDYERLKAEYERSRPESATAE